MLRAMVRRQFWNAVILGSGISVDASTEPGIDKEGSHMKYAIVLAAAAAVAVFGPAASAGTLDYVKAKGFVQCGVSEGLAGFSDQDENLQQTCQRCHGDVTATAKVQQNEPLKMGQCLDCHKKNSAPTDCTTCHY